MEVNTYINRKEEFMKRIINEKKVKIVLTCIVFIVCLFFCIFVNPNKSSFKVELETKNGDSVVCLTYDNIPTVIFKNEVLSNDFKVDYIEEIRLYGDFESVCDIKISSSEFLNYFIYDESKGIMINNEFVKLVSSLSNNSVYFTVFKVEICVAILILQWILINILIEFVSKNDNTHRPIYEIRRFCSDIRKYGAYIINSAKMDLRAEVSNSYLNRLWWLAEPFFNMVVYVVVFSKVLGASVRHYEVFVFSSLLMWTFFNKVINYSVQCIRANREVVINVYVPKHILLLSNMILDLSKFAFALIILLPMLLFFNVKIGIATIEVFLSFIIIFTLAFSFGMIFMHFGVYVDDLSYAVGILLQMLMFLSGVFYDVLTNLPYPFNQIMLCLNPVALCIDSMRTALLYNRISNIPFLFIWYVLSLLIGYIGIHTIYKYENGYVKII